MNRACCLILLLAMAFFARSAELPKGKAPAGNAPPAPEGVIDFSRPGAALLKKMDRIILPKVKFDGATLQEALDDLSKQSRTLDKEPGPPESKGVKITLPPDQVPENTSISLDLTDVPLSEALRYVTELSQMRFKVREKEVVVVMLHACNDLYTRTFKVPAGFFYSEKAKPDDPPDPFAPAQPEPTPENGKIPRQSAQQILQRMGITFPEDASADYNPTTRLLTVVNSLPNLDLVEAYLQTACVIPPLGISTSLTVIEAPGYYMRKISEAAAHTADMTAELTRLLEMAKSADSRVHVMADAFLRAKPGQQSSTRVSCERAMIKGLNADGTDSAKEQPLPGFTFESNSVLAGNTIPITTRFSVKFQPPAEQQQKIRVIDPQAVLQPEPPRPEAGGVEFSSTLVSASGETKLIGMTRPLGQNRVNPNTEVYWAAFLTCTAHLVEAASPLPASTPQAARPALPAGMAEATLHAPEGLLEFLMEGPPQPLREWLEKEQDIPFPAGAVLERQGADLHVVNTPPMIEALCALIEHAEAVVPSHAAFTLHTLEAPAALLRDLSRQSAQEGTDDTALYTAASAAAARGEGRFIDSIFLTAMSKHHAVHEAVRDYAVVSTFGLTPQGRPRLTFTTRKVGSVFEVDPVISTETGRVAVKFSHALYPTAPESHATQFMEPTTGQRYHLPIADFHVLKTQGEISLIKGGVQLISLQQPPGGTAQGKLWATFLRCDVVPQLSSKTTPQPLTIRHAEGPPDTEPMETKSYRVPADFMTRNLPEEPHASPDPFDAEPPAPNVTRGTGTFFGELRRTLAPEGSSMSYNPTNLTLVVRNTPRNLALIEVLLDKIKRDTSATTSLTAHIFQAPGPLLRRLTAQASSKTDHRTELDELKAAAMLGSAQLLSIAHLEFMPGLPAHSQQGVQRQSITEVILNAEGSAGITTQSRNVGFRLALEMKAASGKQTEEADLISEFHTAPPLEHPLQIIDAKNRSLELPLTDCHTASLRTRLALPDGTARLISMYKPTGKPEFEKEDILQAIFITSDVQRVGE